jgi:hypothetical protein
MFSDRQLDTLRAAVNRIIPPDEFPGGWEGGVGDYLFQQFQGDLKGVVETYQNGLDALDTEAQAVYGKSFDELGAELQDQLLSQIELGSVNTQWPVDATVFFRMLVNHTIEGFYSDPGNGGNRDTVSWTMIGFEVTG